MISFYVHSSEVLSNVIMLSVFMFEFQLVWYLCYFCSHFIWLTWYFLCFKCISWKWHIAVLIFYLIWQFLSFKIMMLVDFIPPHYLFILHYSPFFCSILLLFIKLIHSFFPSYHCIKTVYTYLLFLLGCKSEKSFPFCISSI